MQIDQAILNECAEGNRLAQKKLYELCFHSLMPVCFSYFTNEEDARHVLNMGFLKICEALKTDTIQHVVFRSWSKRIMVNTIIDEYRKNKKHIKHLASKENDYELEVHQHAVLNDAESTFGECDIKKLVESLPPITGRVFMLFAVEGYSHKEIADLLNINEGTSKWHLSTGRKLLREWLEKIENSEMLSKRLVI